MSYKEKSPIPIIEGGTNATSMATTDGTVYFDGTRLVTTATGTAGQILTSAGVGLPPAYQTAAATTITLTGDSGGGLTSGSFTFTASGIGLSFAGAGTTFTLGGTLKIANGGTNATSFATTDGTVIFDGTRLVTLASTGTTGQALVSAGAGVAPAYGTLPIAGGGTNATSFATTDGTVYFDGTRLVTTATGTSGQVLTSGGAGVAPAYATSPGASAVNSVVIQTFTASGTYTPTSGMVYCVIELVGGGGGGGGAAATTATQVAAAAGGAAGGYSRRAVSAATIGSSQTVTIGAAGTAGSAGNNAGGTGGTTSVGSLISATGGVGGSGGTANNRSETTGPAGGTGSTGNVNITGGGGGSGFGIYSVTTTLGQGLSGFGGASFFGGGAAGIANEASAGGSAGVAYGSGGSGGISASNTAAAAGGAGAAGLVIITEYIH